LQEWKKKLQQKVDYLDRFCSKIDDPAFLIVESSTGD
jgi:hypothetical protein